MGALFFRYCSVFFLRDIYGTCINIGNSVVKRFYMDRLAKRKKRIRNLVQTFNILW